VQTCTLAQQFAGVTQRQRLGKRRHVLRRQHRGQHFRALAQQHRQAVARLCLGHFQQRDVGLDRLQAGAAALHIQFAAGTQFPARLGQLLRIAQVFQRVLGHRDALLRATQLEVVACHFGSDQHLRIGQVGLLGTEIGACGFCSAALAAEQIQLPARIEAELVAFTEHPLPTQLRIGLLAAVVAAVSGNVRGLVEAALDEHRTGLADAGHGHAQVQVVRQRAVHQFFQHRIVELRPPAGHRRSSAVPRLLCALQDHRLLRRGRVVGADADTSGQHQAGDGHRQCTDHHGSTSPR